MGGVKNPFGGGNIGNSGQVAGAIANPFGALGEIGLAAASGGKNLGSMAGGLDTSIKDPAGMNQYTGLANQAEQEYGNTRKFMTDNVDPKKKALLDQLAAQANGTAPSIAESQLKSAFDKSLNQQLAMARSSRGGNAGLANRNASNQAMQQQQNIAGQAATERMKEQLGAQGALQTAIQNEQMYATGTLGSALGAQANVAAMQNGQRDRNDKRNQGIFDMGAQLVGGLFGMAEGGQVPSLEAVLKSKYGSKPQKLAYGGQYQADTGGNAVAGMIASTDKIVNEKKQGPASGGLGAITGKLKGKKTESDDYAALDSMVEEFDAEDLMNQQQKIVEQQKAVQSFVPRMPGPGQIQLPASTLPMSRIQAFSNGGNVPGNAQKSGDSYANDKVPALLSPGEVVVPRSVIDEGPVAAAHFIKNASNDQSYNAKTFHAEKKPFASMLAELNDSEERYNKVKNIIKKGR